MPDKVKTASEILDELGAAVILSKSVSDMVSEALALHTEAINYDKLFAEALGKAQAVADGEYDPETKKPALKAGEEADDGDGDCTAKMVEIAELTKAAHSVVDAYIAAADDAKDSPFVEFAKKVKDYHTLVNSTLDKNLDDWKKKAAARREAMSKADDPKVKELATIQADDMDLITKSIETASSLAKGFVASTVYPRPVIKLDPPMEMSKGYFTIATKDDLMSAIAKYKEVPIKDQPPVFAHIMDCAKALQQKLPDKWWHEPVTLDTEKTRNGGATETARVTNLSDADKSAAMAKGVTIIGPTGSLLASIRAINSSTLLERMTVADPKSKQVEELKGWLTKGDEILKALVANEAMSIRILDIPTFPDTVLKADHWAAIAAKAVAESVTDAMPVEERAIRKELGTRLEAAATSFIEKAATADDLAKDGAAELKTITAERDGLKKQLAEFTTRLIPLTRGAQEQKKELKKLQDQITAKDAELAKLKAEPMPSKGRVGAGGKLMTKADDGADHTGEETGSGTTMAKVAALPPGARSNGLLDIAWQMRGEEDDQREKRR